MSSDMVTEDSAVGIDCASASLSTCPINNPTCLATLVEGMQNLLPSHIPSLSPIFSNSIHTGPIIEGTNHLFCGAYETLRVIVSGLIGTHDASAPTSSVDLESGGIDHEARDYNRAPEPGTLGGQVSIGTQFARFRLAWRRVAARHVALLSMIVVPGLVLGVVTGQLPWGIALCGAIATVLSFFVSLRN